ncbi:MAG TPA: diadenylate cyclase CdaA [Candidatus Syntrophosphaera sp.]|nr:diadenylate cyclase CdaA [Candidatus Cloacimonadota bacterium]HOR03098.1 diadenylate cyclase CdaA [Candidatus Syntrophosphaera sp.]HOG31536.1 diadenylate cyclase CdaA [Candidatus Cloacimonadota bacterium]HPB43251.1 diadenylate cyclase CdaA [Candidatus Syntrophosphaera sp.]HQG94183.1 diadenylate cyclase CdaA [Candidatus Syntrophosphaera sp.]
MEVLIPTFSDLADIFIIAFLFYQGLCVLRRGGGWHILAAIVFLVVLSTVAEALNLRMVTSMLNAVRNFWVLALVIIFQPELRALLARINLSRELNLSLRKKESNSIYMPLIDAISSMSFRKTGALVVIENRRKLTEYINSGEIIDATLSLRLILTIFNPRSALHDGAIIIRGDRIMAAKVVLPLSKKSEYSKRFGTRHLAGIGITEISDAIAIIVSEQNSQISVARDGKIQVNVAYEELLQIITDATS